MNAPSGLLDVLWQEVVSQKAGKVNRGGTSRTGTCWAWVPQPKGRISHLSQLLGVFFALLFKGAMLLVTSFCAVRRLCSLAEASGFFGGDRTTAAYVHGAGCSAPCRSPGRPLAAKWPASAAFTAFSFPLRCDCKAVTSSAYLKGSFWPNGFLILSRRGVAVMCWHSMSSRQLCPQYLKVL